MWEPMKPMSKDFGKFDIMKAKSASGWFCGTPVFYPFQGAGRSRRCGRCKRCVAFTLRDMTGRLSAECRMSAETVTATWTYAPVKGIDPPGASQFIAEHRSKAIDSLRMQLTRDTMKRLESDRQASLVSLQGGYFGPPRWGDLPIKERGMTPELKQLLDQETPRFVYYGVGEKGDEKGRVHWHLILFFDKPSGLPPSKSFKDKRGQNKLTFQHFGWWPHGHVTLDIASTSPVRSPVTDKRTGITALIPDMTEEHIFRRFLSKVVYVVGYLEKSRGTTRRERKMGIQPDAVYFRSQSRPLGVVWIMDQAREYARQGLPFHGMFTVPGLRSKKAKSATGEGDTPNMAVGVTADYAIAAYKEEWQRLRPGIPIPCTDYLYRRDKEYNPDDYVQRTVPPMVWPEAKPLPKTLPPRRDKSRCAVIPIVAGLHGVVGVVTIYDTGVARLTVEGQKRAKLLPPGDLTRFFPLLDARSVQDVEAKLIHYRGENWLSPAEHKLAETAILNAQHEAIAAFARREDESIKEGLEGTVPDTRLRRQMDLNKTGYYDKARQLMRQTDTRRAQLARQDADQGILSTVPRRGKDL